MVELNASGDIFRADATAGFDEGIVRGKVGAGARLSFEGEFDLCHGLNAALSAEAAAEVAGQLGLLWLMSGRVEGEALAGAGAKLDARITVDLFDTFGLSAEVAAFAEAAVAGRLSIGLDFQDIAHAAKEQMPGLAYDIFIAFLNEINAGGGVWAKLAAAAMAKAHLNIRGSLSDDNNAGFIVEAGAEVGVEAGAGFDVFLGLKMTNSKRFFLTASERISFELVKEAHRHLPKEFNPVIEMLEFLLPTTLNAAYELGQYAVLQTLRPSENLVSPFTSNFGAQMQRYLLDKLGETGINLISQQLRALFSDLEWIDIDEEQRSQVIAEIQSLINTLDTDKLGLDDIAVVVSNLVNILTHIAGDYIDEWRRYISITWMACASANAIRSGVSNLSASASASLAGLGAAATSGHAIILPEPPAVVQEEIAEYFGGLPGRITVSDAVDYLIGVGVAPMLHHISPQISQLMELLEREIGITPGSIIEDALTGQFGKDLAQTDLYIKLRSFVKKTVETHIIGELISELKEKVEADSDTRIWINEVAEPSLLMTSGFVFEQLDALIGEGLSSEETNQHMNTLRTGLSNLMGKIFVRNVVVISDIVINHVISELRGAFLQLESNIRNSSGHPIANAGVEVAASLLPPVMPIPTNFAVSSRDLMAELCGAAAAGFSHDVWTVVRRNEYRELMISLLLSVDGEVDYSDPDAVKTFFAHLFECLYVPAPEGLIKLIGLFGELLSAQLGVMLPKITRALEVFFLSLTYEAVVEMERVAGEFIDTTADAARDAWVIYNRWRSRVNRLIREVQDAIRELSESLEEAADILRLPSHRSDILNKLMADTIAEIQESIPGETVVDDVAVIAFVTAFNLARPAMDSGLTALGVVADSLGDLTDEAANLPDLISRIGDRIVEEVKVELNHQLSSFGVSLPDELSIDDVASAAKSYITNLWFLRESLMPVIEAKRRRSELDAEKSAAESTRERKKEDWKNQNSRHQSLLMDEIGLEITSPTAITENTENNWSYGRQVPLCIVITGGSPSLIEAGAPKRVHLSLNGQIFTPTRDSWNYAESNTTMTLSYTLSTHNSSLKPGMNTLECSVTNGLQPSLRKTIVFTATPNLTSKVRIEVDEKASCFNTPLDDHTETEKEKVVLKNAGTVPVALEGWRLFDRARHRYDFPEIALLPGKTITLHTGKGRNTDSNLYWGKSRAVWNNRGDSVYLIDRRGVLILEYVY